jgi:chemotaxis signal transduction protein
MTASSFHERNCPEEISLLTFSISGIKMGVDTEQVDEMMDVETAGLRKLPLHYLSEKLSFGERTVTYRAPVAILMKDARTPFVMVIDDPEDIAIVNVRSIRPIPMLIAQSSKSGAIWGAVIINEQVIFLLDFQKLFAGGIPSASSTENRIDLYNEGGKV